MWGVGRGVREGSGWAADETSSTAGHGQHRRELAIDTMTRVRHHFCEVTRAEQLIKSSLRATIITITKKIAAALPSSG